ncbi:MAG: hydantoinase/oxoprolinase family protein [Erysipelothrix sp.]|nr:hydantoinase/oxoprolinase family protein [Erysipelothrix sp.]
MKSYIIGVDVGGTHIDAVLLKDGKVQEFLKRPYQRDMITESIQSILVQILSKLDVDEIERIQLSTTITTNTVAQKTGDKVDLILMSPGLKHDFSHLDAKIHYLDGYVNHQGEVVTEFDENALHKIEKNLAQTNNLGIIGKFSVRNSVHELKVKEYFRDKVNFITMGHKLSGKLNFKRRVETVYLNNYVYRMFLPFAREVQSTLRTLGVKTPVYILKADGGTILLDEAILKPVETIMSGPAASYMGMKALLSQSGDGILMDIGGTTTDVFFVVDGTPLFEPKGISIGSYKTLIRSIYSFSLPLGGDSKVVGNNGIYEFENRTGFAAGFGGDDPTVTDALVILGNMEAKAPEASFEAISKLDLSKNVELVALEVVGTFVENLRISIYKNIDLVNSRPRFTIKEVLENKQFEPTFIQTIGGPSLGLNPHLQNVFGLKVTSPKEYAFANALGAALSEPTAEVSIIANTRRGVVVVPEFSIERRIDRHYTLEDAIQLACDLLKIEDIDIVEASQYNMVSYFGTLEKNIRVVAQVKPRLIDEWRCD